MRFLEKKNCSSTTFAESKRPPSRASGPAATGSWSWSCRWAPAASWEWEARRRTEETRGAAALRHMPWRKSSGLPASSEAQTRLLFQRLMEWNRLSLREPWRTNPMFKWGEIVHYPKRLLWKSEELDFYWGQSLRYWSEEMPILPPWGCRIINIYDCR